MSVEEQDYKFEVLEYAVNQCINRLLPSSSEDALSVIFYQSNKVVWKVATEIYTKSGYQIDFVFVRDILNLRIEPLRKRIAEEERIRKEKEAEEARIRAKLEAERLQKIAEEERIRQEKEVEEKRLRKQREEKEQQKLQEFKEKYPYIKIDSHQELTIIKNQIITRIKDIIVEILEVEEETVTLYASLPNDLGADELDTTEIFLAIEEEFDMEILEEEYDYLDAFFKIVHYIMENIEVN